MSRVLLLHFINELNEEKEKRIQNKEVLDSLEETLSNLYYCERVCGILANTAMFWLCIPLGNQILNNLNGFLLVKFFAKNKKLHSMCIFLYGKIPYQSVFSHAIYWFPSLIITQPIVALILRVEEHLFNFILCFLMPDNSLKNLKDVLIFLKDRTFLGHLVDVLIVLKFLSKKQVNQGPVNEGSVSEKNLIAIAISGLFDSF